MLTWVLLVWLGTLCVTQGAQLQPRMTPQDKIKTHETENLFLDGYGRVRMFHGVNAVVKEFPWYPEWLLNEQMLDDLQDWGLNIVRLGSMWSGAEPTEGQYNQTYIDQLHWIIQQLENRGIYTFLDMHQDCFTTLYNGVPAWLEAKYPPQNHTFPWPLDSVNFWEENYMTEEVSTNFQYFYDNYADSITKWGDLWQEYARQFRSHPSLIGYNLINEPWIGDYLTDAELLLPGIAGRRNLLHNYDEINRRIREIDLEGIVLYEPVMYGQTGYGDILGSGYDRVPGGDYYRNVSAYSFHMYCWATEFVSAEANDTEKEEAVRFCKEELLPLMIESAVKNANTTGGAAILTEFGLCKTWQDEINIECETFLDLCDDHIISWVEWGYPWEWYTNLQPGQYIWAKIDAYLRTYAPAIAGIPSLHRYTEMTKIFTLNYIADIDIPMPTEIYVPPRKYQAGFDIIISPENVQYEIVGNYVHIHNTGLNVNQEIQVMITPN